MSIHPFPTKGAPKSPLTGNHIKLNVTMLKCYFRTDILPISEALVRTDLGQSQELADCGWPGVLPLLFPLLLLLL
jgi:hypothetical protein